MGVPQDGGRGHEWRTEWSLLRVFSWRSIKAHYWGQRRFVRATVCVGTWPDLVLGVSAHRDEGDDRYIVFGAGPLGWLEVSWYDWPRPTGGAS